MRNYVTALELGIERIREGRPITLNLVKELHATLMQGVRGEFASPGQFRPIQNWIGSTDNVEDAAFVPPSPELLMDCLSDWERFVNARNQLPDLIQCAVMHEQFEAIHPFIDGNGRIGRLLITLFLIERERLSQPLLYLSAYIEPRRSNYYDLLQRIRTHGDWNTWLRFFLDGIEQTAQEAVQQTRQLIDLREQLRLRVMDKPKALALVDYLFLNPFITAKRAQHFLDVSDPTARSAIGSLQTAGIITEVTGRAWRRFYLSSPILDILTATGASRSD